jgi:hypothetical protein
MLRRYFLWTQLKVVMWNNCFCSWQLCAPDRWRRGVRHQEIHTFSLGNTRKYQNILGNTLKYQEIHVIFPENLGNIRKCYEIPGNTKPKHEIHENTLVYGMGFLLTGSWLFYSFYWHVWNVKQEILWNTRKYQKHNISGNTWKL